MTLIGVTDYRLMILQIEFPGTRNGAVKLKDGRELYFKEFLIMV
jgi:hypothetical protein